MKANKFSHTRGQRSQHNIHHAVGVWTKLQVFSGYAIQPDSNFVLGLTRSSFIGQASILEPGKEELGDLKFL
jgi:hypothetical protein